MCKSLCKSWHYSVTNRASQLKDLGCLRVRVCLQSWSAPMALRLRSWRPQDILWCSVSTEQETEPFCSTTTMTCNLQIPSLCGTLPLLSQGRGKASSSDGRAVYGDLPYRVIFLIEGEEEIGSPSLDGFLRTHRDRLAADACVWEDGEVDYEGRFLMYLGLRGIVDVELRVRTLKEDVHSGMYSYLPNAAWHLVWALSGVSGKYDII